MQERADTTINGHAIGSNTSALCVFLNKPFPHCYCLNISGSNIPKILIYCADKFRQCTIYRQNIEFDEDRKLHE